ncbi:MAG: T9SS type A sorting domain-containing protein, partial [Bacteroidetes bacterium]|nr:T9SS type A sorting domain-containing protein [Bacteroidota bacterium]
ASDPEGDNLTFSAAGLAALGLSINPNTGDITGTITAGAGVYPVSIQADDDGTPVASGSESFDWTILQPQSAAQTVVYRVNTGGNLTTANDAPNPDWDEDTQANGSPYRNAGSKTNGYNITQTDATVPASTPLEIFQSERFDPRSGGNMEWDFPVSDSGDYEVRLYFADGYSGTNTPGKRIFSVEIEGTIVLPDYDIVADVGHAIGTMKTFLGTVNDGNLDINFLIGAKSTPIISGIEILSISNQSTPPPVAGQWTQEVSSDGSSLVERVENDYVEANGKFYLIGGRGSVGVSIYDPIAKTWTSGSAPPKQLHHFQAISHNGKIYVAGAMTGNYPNESPVDSIYEYDPATDNWGTIAEIPAGRRRGAGGVVVYNNEFYFLSGLTNGHISGHVPWADKYNPATNTWTVLSDAPRARDHFQASVANGKIYLAGGRLSKANDGPVFANTIAAVDVYDIATDTWTTLADSIPTKRAGSSSAVFGDYIMIIGGESDAQTVAHNEVEGLDVNTGTWTSFPTLITGRHGTGSIVYNDRIYVAGGVGSQGGNPKLTSQEYYSTGTTSARFGNGTSQEPIKTLNENSDSYEISVFPNPFSHELNIIGNIPDLIDTPVRLRLFDVRGSLIFEKSWVANEHLEQQIPIPSLAPGLYFYELKTQQIEKKGRLIKVE